MISCGSCGCRVPPECGIVAVEGDWFASTSRKESPPSGELPEDRNPLAGLDDLVLTSREEIPPSGRLPEGGGVPVEEDKLVLTSRTELPPSGGSLEGKVPEGGGVPVGGDILKINQPDGNLAQWWSSRVKVLCFAEEVRGLNNEHRCPSKNQSLEEEEERKEERAGLSASSLNSALAG